MAPSHAATLRVDAADRVRERLLTALHVGRLKPGDRVPSIRRLARLAGVNHKTVHRAYTALAEDGILELRPGSGTFVADRRSSPRGNLSLRELVEAIDVCRDVAGKLGMDAADLARFFSTGLAGGLGAITVGVVECNAEQIAMIARDLHRALGVQVAPISLAALEKDPAAALEGKSAVVTTDCHWVEVVDLVEPLGIPAYAVALDGRFPRHILDLALRDDVLLVVGDSRFGPVFERLLRQLARRPQRLRRVRYVDCARARATLLEARAGSWVYVSPAAAPEIDDLPGHLRRVEAEWHVEARALDALRAGLAADCVAQR